MKLRNWLPFPGLSAFMWLVWLLLANDWSTDQVVLGAVLAWALPLLTRAFWPTGPPARRLDRLVSFVALVQWDILVANITVARLILGPRGRLRPAFVELPLDLGSDFAITVLANTISLTPGTVSADVTKDRRQLLVHVLDVKDEQALIRHIKQRYERPLKEVFGC